MSEMELKIMAILAGLIALGGLTIAAWAVKAGHRLIMAQGMFLLMLGLGLTVQALAPPGVLRTCLSVALYLGALGWVMAQVRFLQIGRRERDL